MIIANKTPRAITVIGYCLLVIVLAACSGDGSEMRAQLEELERQNRADSVMTNDSLAEQLVKYFDRHGTPNERMRAHYILGRTYADMGEAPAALEAYLEAADCADTTQADCDYAKLSRIHAQSARLYNSQIQPRSQLEELRLAQYYAWKGHDTLMAIECFAQTAETYSLMHMPDSVILIREKAYHMYKSINKIQDAARVLGPAITASVECKDIQRARRYIDIYETCSGIINSEGEVIQGRKMYHYVKGKYYLLTDQRDSAEAQFRCLQREGHTLNHQIAASKGLQELYETLKIPDSIARYANLGYQLNDSAYSLSEMESLQRLKASYNYNRNKLLAEQKTSEAREATISLIIISILSVIILLVASYLIYRNRRKQQRLQEAYESAVDKREDLLKELEALRAHDYDTLISQKEDKIKEQNQTIAELEGRSGKVSLRDFKESQIVKTFAEKSQFSKDHPVPNQAEWDMLEQQFRTDMPGLCRLFEDKGLSDLEFRTCLLLLLDYDEGTVAGLTRSSSQTINSAKVRANQKLFNEKGAKSLHRALKKLI